MSGVRHITVSDSDGEGRLDHWFKRHYPQLKFGRLAKLLRTGQIRIDGKRAKPKTRVAPGQVIRIPPLGEAEARKSPVKPETAKPDDRDLALIRDSVLYEDEAVIALNKPPGLAVQGGSGTTRHVDAMLDAFRDRGAPRPRLVHRLDKDTSGVLLIARTPAAAKALGAEFRRRETEKIYWALVLGVPEPDAGTINAPLAKAGGRGHEQMVIDESAGKTAITDYVTGGRLGNEAAWIVLRPLTGRTHQLRAHCALLGTPIVGDRKYGGKDAYLPGAVSRKLHLHARSLTIRHPGGQRLHVTAPLPSHMAKSWQMFGFDTESEEDFFGEDFFGGEGA